MLDFDKFKWSVNVKEVKMEIILFILFCLAYVLPAIIASSKAHPNSGAIWLFTLFLGWTGVAWIIALIWALSFKLPRLDE